MIFLSLFPSDDNETGRLALLYITIGSPVSSSVMGLVLKGEIAHVLPFIKLYGT
jgi:hypothetical protein